MNLNVKDTAKKQLFQFVNNMAFPCIGAKTAAQKDQIDIVAAGAMSCPSEDHRILSEIYRFIARSARNPGLFRSLAIIFTAEKSCPKNEIQFEQELWKFLQRLHNLDSQIYDWDPSVSEDPSASNFSFSFGTKGFYIVGMHPQSSRPARRFANPTLILNLHEQFEKLRADGSYQLLRNLIRRRDMATCGSVNPMMEDFGRRSEAAQYSGRHVEKEWQCPFKANPKKERYYDA